MPETKLTLERRDETNRTKSVGPIDLMLFPGRELLGLPVRLTDRQAVIGFPKYSTIGIGYAVEEADWNSNLPYNCDAEMIVDHISDNKGDDSISRDDALAAIRLIQDAIAEDRSVSVLGELAAGRPVTWGNDAWRAQSGSNVTRSWPTPVARLRAQVWHRGSRADRRWPRRRRSGRRGDLVNLFSRLSRPLPSQSRPAACTWNASPTTAGLAREADPGPLARPADPGAAPGHRGVRPHQRRHPTRPARLCPPR